MRAKPWLLVSEGVLDVGARVALDPAEARHASGALRCRAGDSIMLADGQGSCAEAELIRCVRSDVVAVIGDIVITVEPLRGPTVALGILHSKAMDWAVQKAVEIGVETFIPVLCERSQGSLSHAENRLEHWRRVALQALKQCRRAWAMRVESPLTMEGILKGQLKPGMVADSEGLTEVSNEDSRGLTLLVGPEGGLTEGERDRLETAGWSTLALGPHVLRAETALVVGGALLMRRMHAGVRYTPAP